MKRRGTEGDQTADELMKRLEKLAHGIRTPMHTVLATADLLNDSLDHPADAAQLHTIVQAVHSALECLDRLLRDFKIQSLNGLHPARAEHPGYVGDQERAVKTQRPRDQQSVLLVDDNRVSATLAKEMLERVGFSVRMAADGREAVDKFRTRDFDLVLLDLEMPILNGFQAHDMMRDEDLKRGKKTPIIALTADSAETSAERALQQGFNAYLVKPLTRAELVDTVQSYLASSETSGSGGAHRKK